MHIRRAGYVGNTPLTHLSLALSSGVCPVRGVDQLYRGLAFDDRHCQICFARLGFAPCRAVEAPKMRGAGG